MSGATIFEPILTGHDVEGWCMATLKTWFSTYLAEVERQHGVEEGTWKRPAAWVIAPSFDKWPEDQVPAVVVVSAGLSEKPLKEGSGAYRARWDVVVGCICSARTQQESHAMSMLYTAALRALMVQRPSLDQPADAYPQALGVVWLDEDYTLLDFDDTRSLAAGAARFTIEIRGVTADKAGPLTPDVPPAPVTDPWPLWPTIQTVEVDVEQEFPAAEATTRR